MALEDVSLPLTSTPLETGVAGDAVPPTSS